MNIITFEQERFFYKMVPTGIGDFYMIHYVHGGTKVGVECNAQSERWEIWNSFVVDTQSGVRMERYAYTDLRNVILGDGIQWSEESDPATHYMANTSPKNPVAGEIPDSFKEVILSAIQDIHSYTGEQLLAHLPICAES